MIKKGIYFLTWSDPLPLLPNGWKIEREDFWAVAIDPDGARYLITPEKTLYPWCVCPPEGFPGSALKPGSQFIDTRQGKAIRIP